jgi:hypothetical protein
MLLLFLVIVVLGQVLVRAEDVLEVSSEAEMVMAWNEQEVWGFPSLHLTSELHPFQVEREFWHPGNASVPGEFEHVNVQIRGRGNSTWDNALGANIEKLPLRIRFHEEMYVLNSAYAHRDWVLMANAFDFSLLRNYFVFHLAELMGSTGFVPTIQNFHLYINDEYMGIYQLVDERDIGPGRLDLFIHPDPTISEYMIQLGERPRPHRPVDSRFSVNGLRYGISFPNRRERTMGHDQYAEAYVSRFSQALRSKDLDWDLISSLIDLDSFVEFYLIQELTRNTDVRTSSVFMQIRGQGDARRLYMGPVWDFDVSLGVIPRGSDRGGLENTPEGLFAANRHYWFRHLLSIPEFRDAVVARFNEMVTTELPLAIRELERISTTYVADFNRNFDRHEINSFRCLGRYCENETFLEHIDYMIEFLNDRVAYLNGIFNAPDIEYHIPERDAPFIAWK